ncbi:MAG: hypothetical protein E7327_00180 [Clostridiales bacterium]|nr:hypothetical protein [Clostridiales bacterium]
MREKLFQKLNKIYGIVMSIAFFGGIVPLPFFLAALVIGGSVGENMTVFFYKQFYPWVIALASIAVLIGTVAMYVGKVEGLSVKKVTAEEDK